MYSNVCRHLLRRDPVAASKAVGGHLGARSGTNGESLMRPWKDFVKNRSAAAFIATMIFASNAPQSAENAADGPLQGCEVIDSGQSRDVDSIPQACKGDVAAGRVI